MTSEENNQQQPLRHVWVYSELWYDEQGYFFQGSHHGLERHWYRMESGRLVIADFVSYTKTLPDGFADRDMVLYQGMGRLERVEKCAVRGRSSIKKYFL
jgi:hypothetical protein